MTVRDLLKMDVDVDCYDDVQGGIGIAFCGPMSLTAEGKQKFSGVLDLPVKLDLENNEAIICIDDESDAVWKARYRQAKDFFYSAAGYCSDKDWNRWFVDNGRLAAAMREAGYYCDDYDSAQNSVRFVGSLGTVMHYDSWQDVADWLYGVTFDDPDVNQRVDVILHPEKFDPPRDADDRPSVIEQLAEKKAEAKVTPTPKNGEHGKYDPSL